MQRNGLFLPSKTGVIRMNLAHGAKNSLVGFCFSVCWTEDKCIGVSVLGKCSISELKSQPSVCGLFNILFIIIIVLCIHNMWGGTYMPQSLNGGQKIYYGSLK